MSRLIVISNRVAVPTGDGNSRAGGLEVCLQGKRVCVNPDSPDSRPVLVFFGAANSGPARRMESLVAHLARKERGRLRVTQVDIDEQPELAEHFNIHTVPTLALVKGKRVVERLEGRVSAPRIERMLEPHLGSA